MNRFAMMVAGFAAAGMLTFAPPAPAQAWPAKPVKVIVPPAPGTRPAID